MLRHLRPGDLVELVSPSGAIAATRADRAIEVLTGWGLRVRLGAHALGRHTYLAGTDDERLADLNQAFRDPEVRAVLCLRGGYGAQRIADRLDLDAVRADPKLLLGFSDITALHLALWTGAGLPTLHGPTVGLFERGPSSLTATAARQALMTAEPLVVWADEQENTFPVRRPGVAEGRLLGGNLTMLSTSIGTAHVPDLRGAILLLEDVAEEPYRVDRMLVHLARAGLLDGVAGVAVGQFTDCDTTETWSPSVADVLVERLCELEVPLLGGLPFGHGAQQATVGLGVPARLDASAGTLTVDPVAR